MIARVFRPCVRRVSRVVLLFERSHFSAFLMNETPSRPDEDPDSDDDEAPETPLDEPPRHISRTRRQSLKRKAHIPSRHSSE